MELLPSFLILLHLLPYFSFSSFDTSINTKFKIQRSHFALSLSPPLLNPHTTKMAALSNCTGNVYVLPDVTDAACGAPISGNMTSAFDSCCKGNSPVKYENDCGIYCLAQEQTVDQLTKCLEQKSGTYSIFCNKRGNATATATATKATTGSPTGSSTGTSAPSTSSGAAVANQPVSMTGLGVIAMMFCSALLGVVA